MVGKKVHSLLKQLLVISKSSKNQVNIAESAFSALANLVSNILVSKSLFDDTKRKGGELKNAFWELIKVLGSWHPRHF